MSLDSVTNHFIQPMMRFLINNPKGKEQRDKRPNDDGGNYIVMLREKNLKMLAGVSYSNAVFKKIERMISGWLVVICVVYKGDGWKVVGWG